MKEKIFIGIDISTTTSWLVFLDSSQKFIDKKFLGFKNRYWRDKSKLRNFKDCLKLQHDELKTTLQAYKKKYHLEVFIEVPQFNNRNFAGSFKLQVLFGLLAHACIATNVFWVGVNTNVYKPLIRQKCFYVSKHRKREAIKWVNVEFPELEIEDHNIADALSIAYFASLFTISKNIKDKFIINSKRDCIAR